MAFVDVMVAIRGGRGAAVTAAGPGAVVDPVAVADLVAAADPVVAGDRVVAGEVVAEAATDVAAPS